MTSYYKVHPTLRDRYTARRGSSDFKCFDTFDEAQAWADAQNAAIRARRAK